MWRKLTAFRTSLHTAAICPSFMTVSVTTSVSGPPSSSSMITWITHHVIQFMGDDYESFPCRLGLLKIFGLVILRGLVNSLQKTSQNISLRKTKNKLKRVLKKLKSECNTCGEILISMTPIWPMFVDICIASRDYGENIKTGSFQSTWWYKNLKLAVCFHRNLSMLYRHE